MPSLTSRTQHNKMALLGAYEQQKKCQDAGFGNASRFKWPLQSSLVIISINASLIYNGNIILCCIYKYWDHPTEAKEKRELVFVIEKTAQALLTLECILWPSRPSWHCSGSPRWSSRCWCRRRDESRASRRPGSSREEWSARRPSWNAAPAASTRTPRCARREARESRQPVKGEDQHEVDILQ